MDTLTIPIPSNLGTKQQLLELIADAHNWELNNMVQEYDADGNAVFTWRKDKNGNDITEVNSYQTEDENGEPLETPILLGTEEAPKDVPVMRQINRAEYGKRIVMEHLNKLVQKSLKKQHQRNVGKFQEVSSGVPMDSLVALIQ